MLTFLIWGCSLSFVSAENSPNAEAGIQNSLAERQAEQLGLEELSMFWDSIVNEYGSYLPESQKGSLMDFIKGEKIFSLSEWLKGISSFAFQELVLNGKLLGSLLILTIFSLFLQSLHNAFEKGTVSKAAYAIVFIVLIILALNSFRVAADYALEAIATMTDFIIALLPLMLALIASSGGIASAAFFHPIMLFLLNTSGALVQYAVLPLILMSVLLSIVSSLSDEYKVTRLAQLLRNAGVGLLGVFMTVFLGVISVQGSASAVTDGIAIRTAKFVTGNFVPVIGRIFTDAADTVISASLLLKNTLGIAGVAIILVIAAFPAVKIFILAMVYKLAAALLQPVGDGPVISCLDMMSKNMMFVFAALAIVSLMFFLSITIVILSGNITMMVR